MFTALIVAMTTPAILPDKDVNCYMDRLFDWTSGANRYFNSHHGGAHAFMIVSGLFMDILVLS